LDIVNEVFVQQKNGGYCVATIKKYSLIDLKDNYCVSVSEKGIGCLHQIKLSTNT